jgi:hypothetical protein
MNSSKKIQPNFTSSVPNPTKSPVVADLFDLNVISGLGS